MGIFKRGRWWHLRKRTPRRFQALDSRRPVVIALNTDSEMEAVARPAEAERALWAYWRALEAGRSGEAAERYAEAVELATRRGFTYRIARELAEGPLDEIMARVLRLARPGEIADPAIAAAELGGAEAPKLILSGAIDAFIAETTDRTAGKSDDQLRKWTAPRRKPDERVEP